MARKIETQHLFSWFVSPAQPAFHSFFWCIIVFLGPRQCHSGCKDLFIESVFFQCHSRVRTNILFCQGQFEESSHFFSFIFNEDSSLWWVRNYSIPSCCSSSYI